MNPLEQWDTPGLTWDDGVTLWDSDAIATRWVEQPTVIALWVEQPEPPAP